MWKNFLNQVLQANDTVLGINRRNWQFIKKLNRRSDFPLANDKIAAKKFLSQIGIPVARTLAEYESLFQIEEFKDRFQEINEFVIKPANGSQGRGITVFVSKNNSGYVTPSGKLFAFHEVELELASVIFGKYSLGTPDVALIEERMKPIKMMEKISPRGLFDIRMIIVKEKPVISMLRLPTFSSDGKANLHQGGIGVGVDVRTGRTTHAYHLGRVVTQHPDTKEELIHFQVPEWPLILKYTDVIAKNSPLKYVGIDFTISENMGPSVLEINARPGLEIQNANQLGLMKILESSSENNLA